MLYNIENPQKPRVAYPKINWFFTKYMLKKSLKLYYFVCGDLRICVWDHIITLFSARSSCFFKCKVLLYLCQDFTWIQVYQRFIFAATLYRKMRVTGVEAQLPLPARYAIFHFLKTVAHCVCYILPRSDNWWFWKLYWKNIPMSILIDDGEWYFLP